MTASGYPDEGATSLFRRTANGRRTHNKTSGLIAVMIGSYAALLTTWVLFALLL
jgi:hypothetical protein